MQDSICELSDHGMVITVEERGCLQARVYFRKEVRLANEYSGSTVYYYNHSDFSILLSSFVNLAQAASIMPWSPNS